MRTISGLILVVIATVALFFGVDGVIVSAGYSKHTFPFAPVPVYWFAPVFVASALLGWIGARLLNGGILGRLVRGRGLTPEPPRP